MHKTRLDKLRRAEQDPKKDWEQAVQAVRVANDAVTQAYQKYLEARKAIAEATAGPGNGKALSAKAG